MIPLRPTPVPELEIVCVDDSYIIINKPSGLLSVPGRTVEDSVSHRIQAQYSDALIVHRLDMSTSGIMLMARGKEAQRNLSRQFEQRKIQKRYTAVVSGIMQSDQGMIDLPLITDWPNRPRQMVDHIRGKPSLTYFRILERNKDGIHPDSSRIELSPISGRSHQLRVHLQSLGHPILGDELYANDSIRVLASRLLLHASSICFFHPISAQRMRYTLAPPF